MKDKETEQGGGVRFIRLHAGTGDACYYRVDAILLVRPRVAWPKWAHTNHIEGSWIMTADGERFVLETPWEVMELIRQAQ